MKVRFVLCVTVAAMVAACGRISSIPAPVTSTTNTGNVPSAESRYTLANGCFVLKSLSTTRYAVHGSSGSYAASATTPTSGEPLYVKPAALGKYFFYARDRSFIAASGTSVSSVTAPADAVVWTVDKDASGAFSIVSDAANKPLGVDGSGALVLASAAGDATRFGFEAASNCTIYPEMPVNVEGPAYKGQGVNKPVIGFADGHTHMAMSNELSDGSTSVGPSAGGVLYGQMFNRFGVPEALKDCAANHGPNGVKDAQFIVEGSAPSTHETTGWPTFVGWPVIPNITHQGMYYKWLERAYKAGLRLMVNLGTNIEALCDVAVTAGLGQPGADCKDMSIGLKQIHYTYQLQDYIDAQEGGPGKGWFRIVKTPAEARAVINDGKLAVVLGLEFANIFDCNVTFTPGGSETDSCDQAHIDQRINEVYDLGVRQVYLYHDVNSALGGTGIFNSLSLNLVGFYGTHGFWKTRACPVTDYFAQNVSFPTGGAFYTAGANMTTALPGTGSDPISQLLLSTVNGTVPVYPPGPQCNARGITDLGRYALQQAMKKKFVLDVDHAELSIKQNMIDAAKLQTPTYPLVSMHGGHGGISLDMAKDILNLGGVIFPYNPNGDTAVKELQELKKIWPQGRPLAMGYGFDGNGFGGMPGPRGASHPQIKYPFKLFEGPGWGPQFAAAGIAPVTVGELTIPESGKSWNADVDGEPHYGLVADLVEEIRLEGGEEAISAFYNSAEAYIEMWEKVDNR